MDKITEYYLKLDQWIKEHPVKASLIGMFFIGFIVGAILF